METKFESQVKKHAMMATSLTALVANPTAQAPSLAGTALKPSRIRPLFALRSAMMDSWSVRKYVMTGPQSTSALLIALEWLGEISQVGGIVNTLRVHRFHHWIQRFVRRFVGMGCRSVMRLVMMGKRIIKGVVITYQLALKNVKLLLVAGTVKWTAPSQQPALKFAMTEL